MATGKTILTNNLFYYKIIFTILILFSIGITYASILFLEQKLGVFDLSKFVFVSFGVASSFVIIGFCFNFVICLLRCRLDLEKAKKKFIEDVNVIFGLILSFCIYILFLLKFHYEALLRLILG